MFYLREKWGESSFTRSILRASFLCSRTPQKRLPRRLHVTLYNSKTYKTEARTKESGGGVVRLTVAYFRHRKATLLSELRHRKWLFLNYTFSSDIPFLFCFTVTKLASFAKHNPKGIWFYHMSSYDRIICKNTFTSYVGLCYYTVSDARVFSTQDVIIFVNISITWTFFEQI